MFTPQDTEILQQARLARFQAFTSTNLIIIVKGNRLILQGADPTATIAQADTLLHQAAIILGTSKLQILDTNNNLVFAAELKSEQTYTAEEVMTAATAQRSVEFEVETKELRIVPFTKITRITNETEKELRQRLQASLTPFHWVDDTWGVDEKTASQLVMDFRIQQGERDVRMLFSTEQPDPETTEPATSKSEETNGHKPKAEKPEFQPLKRGATATLEKYLKFVAGDDETKQMEILSDIADEGTKGKRHVNKILGSYPEDTKKPKASEFYVAASRLMSKRDKVQDVEDKATDEQTQEAVAE
ncbi:hypothetical protein LC593_10495 [Nostoc sp. CHAB 5844]|nr:hypothetical protein [Nostoc sp. CHAB 5844]